MYLTRNAEEREEVYLIDRKNTFYLIPRVHFPIANDPSCKESHTDTLVDGELVLDVYPDGRKVLRFLVFDCIVHQGKDLRIKDLAGRLGYLSELFLRPLHKFLHRNPDFAKHCPFKVEFKKMEFAYAIVMMYKEIIPNLHHGNDGLIFTSMNAPYTCGTDQTLLKWKPANENSVDFTLRLDFPIGPNGEPDYDLLPRLGLFIWLGGHRDRYYADLYVMQQDWEKLKSDGEKYGGLEGAVVECRLDEEKRWRYMRIRDDKEHGNHEDIVEKVLQSITDGVTMDALAEKSFYIRKAFKERQAKKGPQ